MRATERIWRGRARRRCAWLCAAAAAIACANILAARGNPLASQLVAAIVALLLINAGIRDELTRGAREDGAGREAARALALLAVIAVAAPALPLRDLDTLLGPALLAVVAGLAALRLVGPCGLDLRALLRFRPPVITLYACAVGLVLGFGAYRLGAPALEGAGDDTRRTLLALLVAAVVAVGEELVFRGIVQITLQRVLGGSGAVLATALFACAYLSIGSASLVLVITLAGLLFALSVTLTGTLGGAVAGHIAFAAGATVVWPALFGTAPATFLPEPHTAIALAVVALAAALLLARAPVAHVPRPGTGALAAPRGTVGGQASSGAM